MLCINEEYYPFKSAKGHTHNVVVITRRWEYTFLSFVSSVTTLTTENLLRISV